MFVAIFVALLIVPGLYQLAFGVRAQDVARWRTWLEQAPRAADGLRQIERDVDARFLLATLVRTWIDPEPPQRDRRVVPRMVFDTRAGLDGYFFNADDYAVPRAAGFMEQRLRRPTDARAAFVDLDRQLRARGVHLLVVPVTPKASLYPDKLDATYSLTLGPDLNRDHHAWFAALDAAGVDAFDMTDVLWRERLAEATDPPRRPFTRGDTHWTFHAMSAASDAVAVRLRPWLGGLEPRGDYRRESAERARPTDLLVAPSAGAAVETERRSFLLDGRGRIVLADDVDAPVLVLGDSFAANNVNDGSGLAQALSWAIGLPVRSAAAIGANPTVMREPLQSAAWLRPSVRVVVVCFTMRRLIADEWRTMPVGDAPR